MRLDEKFTFVLWYDYAGTALEGLIYIITAHTTTNQTTQMKSYKIMFYVQIKKKTRTMFTPTHTHSLRICSFNMMASESKSQFNYILQVELYLFVYSSEFAFV